MTEPLPLYQIDAFAEKPFTGNPAAVVPLDAWLSDDVLQGIALENNLAETAFIVPLSDGKADFHLRWFTPTKEVDLCGHATLATAAALWGPMGRSPGPVRFQSRSGILTATPVAEGRVELDFPIAVPREREMPPGLIDALGGVRPAAFLKAKMNMAVLDSEAAVRAVRPDFAAIAALDGDGMIVTAPGDSCDTASRYFAPASGIPEDPVTGSAHCTLVPYWAEVLGKTRLHCRQVSARGGDLYCELKGDRLRLSGAARLYLEGRIFV
jgi:PhzF family phenazine biosynthesis protein